VAALRSEKDRSVEQTLGQVTHHRVSPVSLTTIYPLGLDRMTLTNEQGFICGAPVMGVHSKAAQNYDALVDTPAEGGLGEGLSAMGK